MRRSAKGNSGSALVSVMVLIGASLLLLGAALSWMSNHKSLTHRYSQYTRSVSAAEAATEKVIVALNHDYKNMGALYVSRNLDKYKSLVPRRSEHADWANFVFEDSKGNPGRIDLQYIQATNLTTVSSQYRGLLGYPNTFRIISHAHEINSPLSVKGSVEQQVQVSLIPLYQFAMFYNLDYECGPGPAMVISGPVHCNGNIHVHPGTGVTFNNDVTCTKKILRTGKEGNPNPGTGPVTYKGAKDGGVSNLTLPIGTNNSIAAVREVIEVPPPTEDPVSPIGLQRFYNRAEMIVVVSNTSVKITSGRYNNFGTTVLLQDFVTTNAMFYNGREKKTVRSTDIDIAKFIQWKKDIARNPIGFPLLGVPQDITTIYVADFRTTNSTTQMGIRLKNGQTLPPEGLTVCSPYPVYILGHYNCPNNAHLGTTNTTATAPASIVADAITILSSQWNDNNGLSLALGSRIPVSTTVNAAFVAGIVQTSLVLGYSGGVENFPRFLEDWSNKTLTYNGSMVVMYESKHAVAKWDKTGTYYNAPIRNWYFDTNFRNPLRLPPSTPNATVLIRGKWALASAQ